MEGCRAAVDPAFKKTNKTLASCILNLRDSAIDRQLVRNQFFVILRSISAMGGENNNVCVCDHLGILCVFQLRQRIRKYASYPN